MIGDRMDTDVVAGIEAGLRTVLVLTGIDPAPRTSTASRSGRRRVVDSVADLVDELPTALSRRLAEAAPNGPRRRARRRGPTGGEGISTGGDSARGGADGRCLGR